MQRKIVDFLKKSPVIPYVTGWGSVVLLGVALVAANGWVG